MGGRNNVIVSATRPPFQHGDLGRLHKRQAQTHHSNRQEKRSKHTHTHREEERFSLLEDEAPDPKHLE